MVAPPAGGSGGGRLSALCARGLGSCRPSTEEVRRGGSLPGKEVSKAVNLQNLGELWEAASPSAGRFGVAVAPPRQGGLKGGKPFEPCTGVLGSRRPPKGEVQGCGSPVGKRTGKRETFRTLRERLGWR